MNKIFKIISLTLLTSLTFQITTFNSTTDIQDKPIKMETAKPDKIKEITLKNENTLEEKKSTKILTKKEMRRQKKQERLKRIKERKANKRYSKSMSTAGKVAIGIVGATAGLAIGAVIATGAILGGICLGASIISAALFH